MDKAVMLHLGRSSSVPAHGAPSLRPLKHPHCTSSCVYLWRLLNKTHPLFPTRQRGFHFSGHPQKLYTSAGIPLSPSFARRKLAVARGFVTQEKAHNEGEDGEGTFRIPTDLPWTVNTSSAVHNWGTIYQGPLEAKYYNRAKDFCYPVGYACIKIYKEKEYFQSIEEGPSGPVFVVRELGLGILKSSSPQRVWNKVCEHDGIRVHGMRHFGFESSEVLRILRAMVLLTRGHPHQGTKVEIDTSIDVLPMNSYAEEMNSEDAPLEAYIGEGKQEPEHVGIKAEHVDVKEDDVSVDDDDDDMDLFDVESNDDGRYVDRDASVNAQNDEDEGNDVFHSSEDDDSDFGEVDEEEEDKKAGTHVSTDERTSSMDIISNHPKAGGSSSSFKRTFRSGPRKLTFTRLSRGADDLAKHDYAKEGSNYQTPHSPSRQKTLATAERQVWRKGEGLTGYVPKQQVPEKSGVDEQGEDVTDIVLDYGTQQAADRIQMGDQGEGLLHNVPGLDKQLTTERVTIDDSRVSSSFNNTNVVKSWESSALKRKEDIPKSSHMLLELLNKWNKATKWNYDSRDSLHQKVEKKFSGHRENAHSMNELNMDEDEPEEMSQSRFIKDEEPALDELYDSRAVDESTNFAVSKLFESEVKLHRLWDDGNSQPSRRKPISNVSRGGVGASRGVEILNMDQNFLDSDGLNGPKNQVQDGIISFKSPEEKNSRISLTGKQKNRHEAYDVPKSFGEQESRHEPYNVTKRVSESGEKGNRQEPSYAARTVVKSPGDEDEVPKRGDDEIQLIEEVRKLIARKKFQEAFKKVRGMKLSGMKVDEDVYEAVLGFKLDPWQKEAFKQVNHGYSVLISGPSGAGKSAVADCCLYNNVVNEQRAIFVTPYEHLANQSLHKFENILGQSNVGGMQTRMRTQSGPKLVVITLQMLSGILHELKGPGGSEFRFFFEGVNMVVLDKFCMFGEMSQGRLWEEIFMLMDPKVQVIALTLPAINEAEIASWISTNRGPCKLVRCNLEPTQKRYLFGQKAGLFPLLDPKGLQVNSDLLKTWKVYGNVLTKDYLESPLCSGYDKLSLTKTLKALDVNAMIPALVVFLDVRSCDIAVQDVLSNGMDRLLSRAETEKVEKLCNAFGEKHPNLWKHIEKVDREGLLMGFAVLHEGKLPLWQDFVIELYQENLVKVIVLTESALLHTELMGRTVVLPSLHKVTDIGVSSMAYEQFLQLVGRAGRRGHDIEGNVIFVDSIHSGPQEAASLLLDNTFNFSSCFKPSYSLVVNLMAKHKLAEVKKILGRSFADFQFFTKHTRDKKVKEHEQEIFECLEAKAKLDTKLFEGLAQVNKHKLSNAAMFTRVDIRMTVHSVSHSGNTLPGILLATVPVKSEPFYMVFGADNNFRLLPAGAFDYVYGSEVSPLDAVIKNATGQALQPPLVPPKEHWIVDEDGLFGYVASGSSQTKEYVRLMMQYPVQPHFARDCLQLRKDIFGLEAQVSNLIEKRKKLIFESDSANPCEGDTALVQMEESETWKAVVRLVHILQKVDALSIIDGPGAYVKLKPLGMLIARLHNVENELWLASVVMSKYVKHLVPAEFTSLMATMIPAELEVEGLFTDQKELSYRVTRSLKDAFAGLEVLRKQIAAVQGSYIPPLQFDTAIAGLVYAWARGKPGTQGIHTMSPNDGDIAWKLRSIARLINSVYQACSQVSVDISEPNDFNNLSTLAKRAEDMIIKHLTAIDRT